MTNKYSELSDFEINKLVAKELHRYSSRHFVGDMQHGDDVEIFIMDSGKVQHYAFFNICENDALSFALMIDDKITLKPVISGNKWTAIGAFIFNKDDSGACASAVNENPCRAIADVIYL